MNEIGIRLTLNGKEFFTTIKQAEDETDALGKKINSIGANPMAGKLAAELLQVADGSKEATAAVAEYIKFNKLSEASINEVINTLRNNQKTLSVTSAEYKNHQAAIMNMTQAMEMLQTQQQQTTQRGNSMNMAMNQLGYVLNDSQVFLLDFRMGLMGISNNLPMVASLLKSAADEAKEMGTTVGQSLVSSLTGAGGLILAINGVMLLLNVLPGLFNDTTDKVKDQSAEIKKLRDEYSKLTGEQIKNYLLDIDKQLTDLEKKHPKTVTTAPGFTGGPGGQLKTSLVEGKDRYGNDFAAYEDLQKRKKALEEENSFLGEEEDLTRRIRLNEEKKRSLSRDENKETYWRKIIPDPNIKSFEQAVLLINSWIEADKKLQKQFDDSNKPNKDKVEDRFQADKAREIQDITNENILQSEKERLGLMEYADLYEDLIAKKEKLKQIEMEIGKLSDKSGQKKLDELQNERDVQQKKIKLTEDEMEAKEKLSEKEFEEWRKRRDKKFKEEEDYVKKERQLEEWARRLEEKNAGENDFEAKRQAAEEEYKANKARIDREVQDENLKVKLLLDVERNYQKTLRDIEDQERKAKIKAAENEVNALSDIFNSLYQIAQSNSREEIKDWKDKESKKLEEDRKTALSHARTQRDRARIDAEYDAKKEALDKKADERAKSTGYTWFVINKQLQAATAVASSIVAGINTMKLLSEFLPPPLPQIAMATTIAAGLAQAAIIEKQKIPGFKTGGLPQGKDAIVQVNEEGQEYIMNAEATRRYLPLLQAINSGRGIPASMNASPIIVNSDSGLRDEIKGLKQELRDLARRPTVAYISEKEYRKAYLRTDAYYRKQIG